MTNPQPEPFDFTELIDDASVKDADEETPETEAPDASEPPVINQSDLEAAYEKGMKEGRERALDALAATEVETLRSIASVLASKEFNFEEAIASEKFFLRESAGAFLEQFCAGVLKEREIELAETLLCQLLSASEDRSRATLFLNPRSVERLEDRLYDLLDVHGVADFISIEGDGDLDPGECRIEWRGGAVRRTNEEIKKAMDDIFGAVEVEQKRTSEQSS